MVGNNPIVLVGTKMDLLPGGTSPKDVASWLTEAAARKRLAVRRVQNQAGVCTAELVCAQPTRHR